MLMAVIQIQSVIRDKRFQLLVDIQKFMQASGAVPWMLRTAIHNQRHDRQELLISCHAGEKGIAPDLKIPHTLVKSFLPFPLFLIAYAFRQHIAQHHTIIHKALVLHRQNVDQPSFPHAHFIHH